MKTVNGNVGDLLLKGTLSGENSHSTGLREGGGSGDYRGPASISSPGFLPQPQISPSLPVATIALNWCNSVPAVKGTSGNGWWTFSVVTTRGRGFLLAASGWRSWMLLNIP